MLQFYLYYSIFMLLVLIRAVLFGFRPGLLGTAASSHNPKTCRQVIGESKLHIDVNVSVNG